MLTTANRPSTAVRPTTRVDQPDDGLVEAAHVLRERATSLRVQADSLTAPLAGAYRRRASELELEAWLDELTAGLPYEDIASPA